MTPDYLEKQLANYQRMLLALAGAVVTLLATAFADIPNHLNPYFPGWFGVWFVLQLAAITPAVVLLLGSEMRKLPFAGRLNTVFGFVAAAWVALVAFGVELAGLISVSPPLLAIFLAGSGVAIGLVYWLLRRSHVNAPEAMFP